MCNKYHEDFLHFELIRSRVTGFNDFPYHGINIIILLTKINNGSERLPFIRFITIYNLTLTRIRYTGQATDLEVACPPIEPRP